MAVVVYVFFRGCGSYIAQAVLPLYTLAATIKKGHIYNVVLYVLSFSRDAYICVSYLLSYIVYSPFFGSLGFSNRSLG